MDATDNIAKLTDWERWLIVAAHQVDKLALVIYNTAGMRELATGAACRAVLTDMGTFGPGSNGGTLAALEAYQEAHRNGDTVEYARVIGDRIGDLIAEWTDDLRVVAEAGQTDGLIPAVDVLTLITEPLDFTNDAAQRLLGEQYMPDPADVATWHAENADDIDGDDDAEDDDTETES